jgi:hypothetical protein
MYMHQRICPPWHHSFGRNDAGRLFCTVGVHPTRCKEFENSGDPEKHLQDLLQLTKDGVARGKVLRDLLVIHF